MKLHPLKIERELRGWSQAKVAEAVGTNVRTVIRWEQGQSVPYPYHRELLCELFTKNARELGLVEEESETAPQETRSVSRSLELPVFDPAIPVNLGGSGSLVGRDHLLSQIKQRLWEGGNFALTALQGLPGMGKTSLAMALAADETIRERFRDGILWAGLGQEPDILSNLARWGKLLGVAPAEVENVHSREAWARALRAAIGARRLLLVIDDAWSIEDALAFQVGGAQCAHLLTTRLPHIAFAFAREGTLTISELKNDDGLALLARFVPQLVQQDPAGSQELVRAVGGLPLALTLMGNYLASQAFTGQARRLQTALTRLRDTEQRLSLSMALPSKERSPSLPADIPLSLHAAIAVSAQRLSPQAHAALCDLAIFPPKPNGFSEEAALAVSAAPVEALDELWDAGLLENNGPDRYTLHQTIADYARMQKKETTAQQLLVKYIGWYIQAHEQDYDALEQEQTNILAGLEIAATFHLLPIMTQGIITLVPFLRVRGHYALADRLLLQGLHASKELENISGQITVLRHLATFAELRGDYALAEKYSRQALPLAQQIEGTADVRSALLTTLGLVAFQRDYAEARSLFEEGLSLAREFGEREQICTLLIHLGRVLHYQGNHTHAETLYQEGLTMARQIEHEELICLLLTYLGAVTLEQGDYARAEEFYQEGLSLARALGYRKQLGALLNDLGVLASRHGKNEEAIAYYQEGLDIARQIGMRADICLCLSNLGAIAAEQKNYALAECYLREGIELARQLDNRNNLALLLSNFGCVLGDQGDYQQANTYFQESLDLARGLGAPWYIHNVLIDWGGIHLNYQQLDAATAAFQEVLTSENEGASEPVMLALARYGLARSAALRGETAEALRLGRESLAQFEALGHHRAGKIASWLQSLSEQPS
jgi:tetratricopeptide (TPR) repeat protein/transcriptional regulator with XRE-family HTH domain